MSKLTVSDLSFVIADHIIFSRLNFDLNAGEILQIVGANGAGKTTLLRIISGLLPSTTGEVQWLEKPIQKIRSIYCRDMLYLGHKTAIKPQLTALENLSLMKMWGQIISPLTELQILQLIGLNGQQWTLAHTLSAGQQRRLHLAKLALLQVRLWILDEPLIALDQAGIQLVENLLMQHVSQGGLVLMTSHQPLIFNQLNIRRMPLNEHEGLC